MNNQKQVANADHEKKNRHKVENTVQSSNQLESAPVQDGIQQQMLNVADPSLSGQASMLGDASVPVVQRQDMAADIGQMQGNNYLQRVISARNAQRGSNGQANTANISTGVNNVIARRSEEESEGAEGGGENSAADQITNLDIQYEIMAHNIGYQNEISDESGEVIAGWGYQPQWASVIDDENTGLFAGLIMPDEEHPELTPVLVFRGTEPTSLNDIRADLHPGAVGQGQFDPNREFIGGLIDFAGGRVNVTGHSLGGALAQHAAVAFPGSIDQVITYQAPAISTSDADQFSEEEDRPDVRHHIASGDVVDTAGGTHLEGDFFTHSPGGFITPHIKFLMTTPEFASQREELGLTDDVLAGLGIDLQENKNPIEHNTEYPHPILNAVDETVRFLFGIPFYPLLSGINAIFNNGADDAVREDVAGQTPEQLAEQPFPERAFMIETLCRGATLNDDEATILTILHASEIAGDVVKVMDLADAHKVCDNVDGDEYDELRPFLVEHYYGETNEDVAFSLIERCIDGRTSEWEEEMIADILVARAGNDGREIITRIGEVYEDGDFTDGLNKLEWQLDGEDQDRIEAVYGSSGRWW